MRPCRCQTSVTALLFVWFHIWFFGQLQVLQQNHSVTSLFFRRHYRRSLRRLYQIKRNAVWIEEVQALIPSIDSPLGERDPSQPELKQA